MRVAIRIDADAPDISGEAERHGADRFQRVALRAPGRAAVRLARRCPDRVIEHGADGFRRQAGAVVADRDLAGRGRYLDHDFRRDAGLLAGVDRVVDQLLQDDERPVIGLVAGLRRQLLDGAEFEQPGGAERLAMQARWRCSHIRLGMLSGPCRASAMSIPASARATAPGPLFCGMAQAVPSPLSFFSPRKVGTFIRPAITMVSIERSFAAA